MISFTNVMFDLFFSLKYIQKQVQLYSQHKLPFYFLCLTFSFTFFHLQNSMDNLKQLTYETIQKKRCVFVWQLGNAGASRKF